ncbi:MAG: FKBP-type peptidyl-prolyl cis-trans isomerase [Gemmatimonadetes bacterium]|jgi:FKBP-type peptidyl-prolyl cis-trans isomerase|nr:FKBP-type peptidyl-prolyl cis-trans isomerase [Gemmatimonadota bacterium]MBT6149977.1 FKBP-type peptidyl-prolyl cis-trans isomerase [Gemmatimonadota bacterium]MBT7863843.1 FKBP-type peptidyl-prolyl cis-trans isomerase [Gemmatimonadota bacterium]
MRLPDAVAITTFAIATVAIIAVAITTVGCSDPCATTEGEDALVRAAAVEGAIRTESGLVFLLLQEGSGPRPVAGNRVQVHYEGRLLDGTIFDSSYERGNPSSFGLDEVIPGWTEGLQMLEGGGKARLTIPPGLAYGKRGKRGKIEPCATLVFDVELLGIYD